jgi:hypothetical protein
MTMADAKDQASGTGPNIPVHPWVAKLGSGTDVPTDLVVLVGFPGPSRESGKVRLYTDLSFGTYIEIPREAVALAEPIDREDENSPTRLHVRASTPLDIVQTSTETMPASFFQGAVASTLLSGAAAPAAAAARAGAFKEPTAFPKCPTWPLFCPTNVIKCQTGHICYAAAQAAVGPTAFCQRPATAGGCQHTALAPYCNPGTYYAVPVGGVAAGAPAATPFAAVGGAAPIVFGTGCALATIHIQTQGCPPCFFYTAIVQTQDFLHCSLVCTNIPTVCHVCPGQTFPAPTDPTGLGG